MNEPEAEKLEKLVRKTLQKLGFYGTKFTAQDLAAAVVGDKGWQLELFPMRGRGALGAVVLKGRRLLIFYRSDMRPFHRDYVIYHELAHVILGHLEERGDVVQYTVKEEREAERVAQYLMKLSTGDGRYNPGLQYSYRRLFE